jgi:hypothetical protein
MKTTLVWILVLGLSTPAFAVDCAVPEGTTPQGVASQGTDARLAFLAKLLEEEGQAARRWTLIWGGAYGVLTIAQLGVMGLAPENEKADWYWGAISTAVGVAFSVLDPLEALDGGAAYAKRSATVAPEQTCQLLLDGERMLREGAEHEELGMKWFIHAGNVLFNLGIGLVLGLGYGRWTTGIVNAAVGVAIGELTIFTSPNKLVPGWQRYRMGGGGGSGASAGVSLHFVTTPGPGVGLLLSF